MRFSTWFPFVPRAHAEAIAADLNETRAKLDAALSRLDTLESKLNEHDAMFSDVPDYWGIRQEIDQRLDELHVTSRLDTLESSRRRACKAVVRIAGPILAPTISQTGQ